jgi:hypothetical protein
MQAGHFVAYRTQPERLTDGLPLLVSRHRIRNLLGIGIISARLGVTSSSVTG